MCQWQSDKSIMWYYTFISKRLCIYLFIHLLNIYAFIYICLKKINISLKCQYFQFKDNAAKYSFINKQKYERTE